MQEKVEPVRNKIRSIKTKEKGMSENGNFGIVYSGSWIVNGCVCSLSL